jgi:hypothetical protein
VRACKTKSAHSRGWNVQIPSPVNRLIPYSDSLKSVGCLVLLVCRNKKWKSPHLRGENWSQKSYPLAGTSDELSDCGIPQNHTLSIEDLDQFFSSRNCLW